MRGAVFARAWAHRPSALVTFPCAVAFVVFNEGWGQVVLLHLSIRLASGHTTSRLLQHETAQRTCQVRQLCLGTERHFDRIACLCDCVIVWAHNSEATADTLASSDANRTNWWWPRRLLRCIVTGRQLVDSASGWNDRSCGDVLDVHGCARCPLPWQSRPFDATSAACIMLHSQVPVPW